MSPTGTYIITECRHHILLKTSFASVINMYVFLLLVGKLNYFIHSYLKQPVYLLTSRSLKYFDTEVDGGAQTE